MASHAVDAGGGAPRRVGSFDVAKALAMVAVIAGHTALRFLPDASASATVALAFSFHMPLFFVVSGYFMRADGSLRLGRDARSLLVPYLVTALAVTAGLCASNLVLHDLGSTRELLLTWLNASVFAQGDMTAHPLWPQTARIGAIWFLWALFWARLEVSLLLRLPSGARMPLSLSCFLIAMVSSDHIFLPLSVQPGICAAVFVYFGRWLREDGRLEKLLGHHLLWVPLALVWAWAIVRYAGFGMAICDYGTTAIAVMRNVAGGLAGTLCVLWACRWLGEKIGQGRVWGIAERMGRITLPVLCVHLFEDNVVRWVPLVEGWNALFPAPVSWAVVCAARVVADFALAWAVDRAVGAARGGGRRD